MNHRRCRRLTLMVLLCGMIALSEPSGLWASPMPPFERDTVTIETARGAEHRFRVEVARGPRQLARGLMFREHLADDQGMLFVFPRPYRASFWMRNTLISLDIIFLAHDGRIVDIYPEAEPLSLELLTASRVVSGALEIRGGLSRRLGLRLGDRVVHRAFE